MVRILAIGDIFGRPGRRAIRELLSPIVARDKVDVVIANAENAAGGKGVTPKIVDELLSCGIDLLTGGNHIVERAGINQLRRDGRLLVPLNLKSKEGIPGYAVVKAGGVKVLVVSLQGMVFMEGKGGAMENPFVCMDREIAALRRKTKVVLVDFHAEATSEKRAMGWFLDGRVSGIVGTHTHVQTCDEEILPLGAAYITDLGMTGPHSSVIGLAHERAIRRFVTGDRRGFKVANRGIRLEGALIDVDESSGRAVCIKRVRESLN